MHRIEPCAPYLPRRASDTNKYDYGRVLIVGGCVGYTGAPTLCAHAALRCGAGLVSVGVPEAIYAITAVKNDAAMPFPLPSADGKLAQDGTVLDRARAPIVLTPHDGEFARLAGADAAGRAEAASAFAAAHGCTVVRKGPETVCAFPDGDAVVLRVGNPGMAKGGSGDVLAGMLGALLCQMPARDAIETAVWLHGRAGDVSAARMGEYAMNPTDVIAALPEVTKTIIR